MDRKGYWWFFLLFDPRLGFGFGCVRGIGGRERKISMSLHLIDIFHSSCYDILLLPLLPPSPLPFPCSSLSPSSSLLSTPLHLPLSLSNPLPFNQPTATPPVASLKHSQTFNPPSVNPSLLITSLRSSLDQTRLN